MTTLDFRHCVTAECNVPASRAQSFLADGVAIGRWLLCSAFPCVARAMIVPAKYYIPA